MKLLDAFLALALTMAILASGTTILVQLFHDKLKRRVEGLRKMLGTVFDRALAEPLKEKGVDIRALREQFVTELHTDTALATLTAGGVNVEANSLTAARGVSLDDALRRLARSELLKVALANLDAKQLEAALHRMATVYSRAEQAATAVFAAQSRRMSYLCGIALAVIVNVDGAWMLNFFAGNPDATRQTIVQLEALTKPATSTDTKPPANASDPAQKTTDGQIRELISNLQSLGTVGVPIGLDFYPYCSPADDRQIDSRCQARKSADTFFTRKEIRNLVLWTLSVVITGMLIGLGGPFWFDVAASLTRLRDTVKSGTKAGEAKPETVDIQARIQSIVKGVRPA